MNVEVVQKMNTLTITQQAALERFEQCYVSKEGDADALKACVHANVDPELIYDIIIYHKEAKDLTEFANTYGWDSLVKNKVLPERFIKDNLDKFNWNDLSSYQPLSEDFIREFAGDVNWTLVFLRDKELSAEFLYEFQVVIKKSIINTLHRNANNAEG